jgi:hypothetical protein
MVYCIYHTHNHIMNETQTSNGQSAMNNAKPDEARKAGRTPPRQPDYQDEISAEQMEAIRVLADPDGVNARTRVLLYSAGW